jgi:hypothetical protein
MTEHISSSPGGMQSDHLGRERSRRSPIRIIYLLEGSLLVGIGTGALLFATSVSTRVFGGLILPISIALIVVGSRRKGSLEGFERYLQLLVTAIIIFGSTLQGGNKAVLLIVSILLCAVFTLLAVDAALLSHRSRRL